jgi:fructosamine-3-kinase
VSTLPAHPLLDPTITAAIEQAARAHLGHSWHSQGFTSLDERSSHPCGIFRGERLSIFAKLGSSREQFTAELAGLRLLTQRAGIPIPDPIADGLIDLPSVSVSRRTGLPPSPSGHPARTLLLLEALPERLPAARQPRDWRSIGLVLATLHQVHDPQFGLSQDNFFGPLRQDNRPAPTWPVFYRDRRLLPLLRKATDSGHLPRDLAAGVTRIAERLPDLGGPDPLPSLLHGDAQQHNFISTGAGAVVIDACPYFGHPEIDLAQAGFFEPVPADLFAAYRDVAPIDSGFAGRMELWRLATYLAVVTVEPGLYLARLAAAIRRYT